MLTLAFDTATMWGRFALARDGQILQYRPLNVSGSYADALLPVMQEMLAEAGCTQNDLQAMAVTVGPGSFTGVRIGVATAKGLAWALGCQLYAVTSLEAMAGALLSEYAESPLAVPVLDARRGEIYTGLFQAEAGWVKPIIPVSAWRPEAFWDHLQQTLLEWGGATDGGGIAPLEQVVFGGDGTELLLGQGDSLRPELINRGQPTLRRWTAAHPATAPALAQAVSTGNSNLDPVHPFTLVPEYLRGSDAEVKRNLDLTPAEPSQDISVFQSRKDPS